MDSIATFSIFSIFIAAPAIVFGFILLAKRGRNQVEMLRYKKEILELELRKEEYRAQSLREENRKLDRIIGDHIGIAEMKAEGRK